MRQYFYHSGNIGKNYLASYARSHIAGEILYLTNILTDRCILICASHEKLESLMAALDAGCSDGELREYLKDCRAEHMLEVLMREGMIE